MLFTKWFNVVLLLSGGICWLSAYLLIIHRSFKDKSYGMPFTGLALNITWEFLYGFIFVPVTLSLQTWVNRCWFLFDILILIAYFRFGKEEWKNKSLRSFFIPHFLFSLIAAYLLLYFFELDFKVQAITYSAFIMNLLLSGLFIQLFYERNSLKGQSFGIALFKLLGTAFASLFLLNGFTFFLQLTGLLCFVLDFIYLLLVFQQYKKENRNIFTRELKENFDNVN